MYVNLVFNVQNIIFKIGLAGFLSGKFFSLLFSFCNHFNVPGEEREQF